MDKYLLRPFSKKKKSNKLVCLGILLIYLFREFPNRTSTVRLKCAEGNEDKPTFKILNEDNWVSEDKNELPLMIMLPLIILRYAVKYL